MKKILVAVCVLFGLNAAAVRADSSLGLGVRVFRATDDLPHQFSETGLGGSISWRTYWTDLVGGQVEMDLYDDGYAGAPQEVVSPQAFLLVGREIYGGVGAGMLFSDGDFSDSPFLVLRAGYQKALEDWVSLDLNVSYEYAEWDGVNKFDESADSDMLVFGAGVRMAF